MANVGYDRLNRKRFDAMARSRLRHRGGTRTARNHDVRATRQDEDTRSERSESKAGAVFDGRDKTQARQGAGTPARQQGRRRRRSIATRIVDERRKSARLMSGRERRAAEPPRSQVEHAKRGHERRRQPGASHFRCGDFGRTCPRRQSGDCRAGQWTPQSPI